MVGTYWDDQLIIPKEFIRSVGYSSSFMCSMIEVDRLSKVYGVENSIDLFYSNYPVEEFRHYINYEPHEKYYDAFVNSNIEFCFGIKPNKEFLERYGIYSEKHNQTFLNSIQLDIDLEELRKEKIDLFYEYFPLQGDITEDELMMIKLSS